MWNGKKVSVIFPAYNEANNISHAIADFSATGVVTEIIVVDNNSTDGTAERVLKTPALLVKEFKQGYGYALTRGLKEATGNYIIMAEPDGTFVGKDVFKLLAYADDFDVVCGTRTTKELIWNGANMGWFLRFGNIIVAKLLEILYNGPSLSDCGCTLRLFRRETLSHFVDKITVGGSHFLPETLILALQTGAKVIEIPVNYRPRVGESKITGRLKGTLKTGFNMIWLILKYKLAPLKSNKKQKF